MRIISSFHDYYDTAMAMGQDQMRVFVRQTEDIAREVQVRPGRPISFREPPAHYAFLTDRLGHFSDSNGYIQQSFLLAFCGRIYSGVKTIDRESLKIMQVSYRRGEPVKRFSNRRERLIYLKKQRAETVNEEAEGEKPIWVDDFHRNEFIAHKDVILLAQHRFEIYHNQVRHGHFEPIRNPKLKDLQFYKVMDAAIAFQELDMFVSGILTGPDRPVETTDDKVRAQQHGFDKCSFRKCPDMEP